MSNTLETDMAPTTCSASWNHGRKGAYAWVGRVVLEKYMRQGGKIKYQGRSQGYRHIPKVWSLFFCDKALMGRR